MTAALAPPLAVGDTVRVKTARRRDVTFIVREITADGRIRAANNRGEAIYPGFAFERVPEGRNSGDAPTLEAVPPLVHPAPVSEQTTRDHTDPAPNEPERIFDRVTVRPRRGECLESLLKRFKRVVERSGVLREYRQRRHFIPKTTLRRAKSRHARARRAKAVALLD